MQHIEYCIFNPKLEDHKMNLCFVSRVKQRLETQKAEQAAPLNK
jgi:hypothetical protein